MKHNISIAFDRWHHRARVRSRF